VRGRERMLPPQEAEVRKVRNVVACNAALLSSAFVAANASIASVVAAICSR